MASLTARICAGAAIGLVAAVSLLNPGETEQALAEPTPHAAANTGSPAGPAFLIDFSRGHDDTTQYLADYRMDEDWIKIVYRPDNIRFDRTGMTLELFKTGGRIPFSGSEFQRDGFYGYGRYEAVLKTAGASGAVTSFFIYTGPHFDNPHDEIDFEFVASKPRTVQLNHFKNGENNLIDIPLWFDPAESQHLYAFEWAPDAIRWFVDGVEVYEVTAATSKAGIPTTSGRVIANLWGASGPAIQWAGEARFVRTSAEVRCISHVPLAKTGQQCSDTFKP